MTTTFNTRGMSNQNRKSGSLENNILIKRGFGLIQTPKPKLKNRKETEETF